VRLLQFLIHSSFVLVRTSLSFSGSALWPVKENCTYIRVHNSFGAVCCAKRLACAAAAGKKRDSSVGDRPSAPRLLNWSQPELINFGILLSPIACDIMIRLGSVLYWLYYRNYSSPATGCYTELIICHVEWFIVCVLLQHFTCSGYTVLVDVDWST